MRPWNCSKIQLSVYPYRGRYIIFVKSIGMSRFLERKIAYNNIVFFLNIDFANLRPSLGSEKFAKIAKVK